MSPLMRHQLASPLWGVSHNHLNLGVNLLLHWGVTHWGVTLTLTLTRTMLIPKMLIQCSNRWENSKHRFQSLVHSKMSSLLL